MKTVEKTCSVFGHSDVDITDDLTERTSIEIERAIEDGVRIFLFGRRSDFDDLCYDLVTEKKNAKRSLWKWILSSVVNSLLTVGLLIVIAVLYEMWKPSAIFSVLLLLILQSIGVLVAVYLPDW